MKHTLTLPALPLATLHAANKPQTIRKETTKP